MFSSTPLSFDALSPMNPSNIGANLILTETRVTVLHLCRWQYRSIFIQIFTVSSERRTCFGTECIMTLQGHPRSLILAPTDRGVNLVGNLGGGRWQTAFGTKLLTRKNGRVKTSDTVEDKNKNVYNYWPAETKAESAPYLGRTWCITVPPFDIFFLGGRVPPVPRGIYAPANRKRVYDFLFDLNSNLGPILPRFRDIRAFVRRKPLFQHPTPIRAKISGCSLRADPSCWGCKERTSQAN